MCRTALLLSGMLKDVSISPESVNALPLSVTSGLLGVHFHPIFKSNACSRVAKASGPQPSLVLGCCVASFVLIAWGPS